MCFSANASFVASGILALIGSATAYKGRGKKIGVFANIPYIFSIQQLAEGYVWLGFNDNNPYRLSSQIGAYIFLFFAYIFWPIATPALLYWFEKKNNRKQLLSYAFFTGIIVALISIIGVSIMGIKYEIISHHIVYSVASPILNPNLLNVVYTVSLLLYAYATIGALFISTIPHLWIFTTIITTGFIVSLVLYYLAFTSVWCFFAALASCALYVIVARNVASKV